METGPHSGPPEIHQLCGHNTDIHVHLLCQSYCPGACRGQTWAASLFLFLSGATTMTSWPWEVTLAFSGRGITCMQIHSGLPRRGGRMQHPFGSIFWGGVGDGAMGDSRLGVILGCQEGLGYVPAGMKAKMGLTIVQCEHRV